MRVFRELERSTINARTKDGITKAQANGVKFERTLGSTNSTTADKLEKNRDFSTFR